MIVVICAGGPSSELCSFEAYKRLSDVTFIGADRGAYHLLQSGITPNIIVGDFDSVTVEEWQHLKSSAQKIEKVKAEKDETDTELALTHALALNPTEIIVTGVTGGRLDHYEAAIRALYRVQMIYEKISCKIVNRNNALQFLPPGRHSLSMQTDYRYISFFAYVGDIPDVTLRGVKYETTEEKMTRGTARFTSNEIVSSDAYIEFSVGICLMIRSND